MMDRDRELHEMADEGRALMSDYIKREDAINTKNYLKRFGCFGDYGFVEIEGVLIALSKIPSADVAPVRHGHWIDDAGALMCSECGVSFPDLHPLYEHARYCPNCGARMDGESDE